MLNIHVVIFEKYIHKNIDFLCDTPETNTLNDNYT